MGEKLTAAQRRFLRELCEHPVFRISGPQKRMAWGLKMRRLISFSPETAENFEMWSITKSGRSALNSSEPSHG